MAEPSVLITGANGYLGLRLAEGLVENTDFLVQLFVHAENDAELNEKSSIIRARCAKFGPVDRLSIIAGELGSDQPFASVEKSGIKQIIHAAAVTRFNVDRELAHRVNTQGSEKLLRFASDCPNLASLQFLSTVYAGGLRHGTIREEALDGNVEFANHYERSKWESEQLVEQHYRHLPINIIRIATLIADNNSGEVSQQNAFHNTLKLFYYGLLSLFPGEKTTPIYLVTGDFVIDAIKTIVDSQKVGGVYHVCHQKNETATLEQLVDTVFATFEEFGDFRTRRVLKPLWSDVESFDLLSKGIGSMSSGVMAQAVSSVAPFSRQLFAAKDFQNGRLRALMTSNYKAPDPLALIARTARYLAQTKWGRHLLNAK